jgi:hypothetical protein
LRVEADSKSVPALNLGAVRLEGRHKTDVAQDRRMEVVRKNAKAFGDAAQAPLDRQQDLFRFGLVCPLSQVANVNGDACYFLAGAVMQIARNTSALGFLRGNEAAGQFADPGVTLSSRRLTPPSGAFGSDRPPPAYEQERQQASLNDDQYRHHDKVVLPGRVETTDGLRSHYESQGPVNCRVKRHWQARRNLMIGRASPRRGTAVASRMGGSCHGSELDQPMLDHIPNELGCRVHVEVTHELVFDGLHRARRKVQHRRDFLHPLAVHDQSRHFSLPRRQAGFSLGCRS